MTISSGNNHYIYFLDDYTIGSTGYIVNRAAGDTSKNITEQCTLKVVDYMIFGTLRNCKRSFIEMRKKYKGKLYHQFLIRYLDHMILVCVKQTSSWEIDLLTPRQIRNLMLFGEKDYKGGF